MNIIGSQRVHEFADNSPFILFITPNTNSVSTPTRHTPIAPLRNFSQKMIILLPYILIQTQTIFRYTHVSEFQWWNEHNLFPNSPPTLLVIPLPILVQTQTIFPYIPIGSPKFQWKFLKTIPIDSQKVDEFGLSVHFSRYSSGTRACTLPRIRNISGNPWQWSRPVPKGCTNPWYTGGRERYRKSSRPGGWILAGSDKEGSGRSGNQLNRKLRIKANTAKVPAGVSSPGSSWNSIYYPPPAGIHRPVDPRGRRHHTGERGGGALTQRYSRGTPPSIVVFQQCCSQSVCV